MGKIVLKQGVKVGDDWTWDTKVAVATGLIDIGNRKIVSEISGVPYDTIRGWQKEEWWTQLLNEIKAGRRADLNNKMSSLVEKTLDVLEDRLIKGDYILNNKTGKIERKPLSAKDANSIANNLLIQKMKLEEQEMQVVEKESTNDMLKLIAHEFSKIHRKIDKAQATDIPFVERVE